MNDVTIIAYNYDTLRSIAPQDIAEVQVPFGEHGPADSETDSETDSEASEGDLNPEPIDSDAAEESPP